MGEATPSSSGEIDLQAIRAGIDALDEQLIDLLNQRAALVLQVAEVKKRADLDIYVPCREESLLKRLAQYNQRCGGLLSERGIRAIFREIMSAALALEDNLRIAYLGPAGSWTHQVAISKFGQSVEYLAQPSVESCFDRVLARDASYAVLPLEHSHEGVVEHTLDHLCDSALRIYAQIPWSLEMVVMAQSAQVAPKIIFGSAQSLETCRPWLMQRFPAALLQPCESSNLAVEAATRQADCAAVGTPLAAELAGLRVLAGSPPERNSQARFIILGPRCGPPSAQDHSMLMIEACDRVGSLANLLLQFARHDIQVRHLETRQPRSSTGPATFFVELSGHADVDPLRGCLEDLSRQGISHRVLGSYPAMNDGLSRQNVAT